MKKSGWWAFGIVIGLIVLVVALNTNSIFNTVSQDSGVSLSPSRDEAIPSSTSSGCEKECGP